MPEAGRVLVVDDNEQVRTLIRRALSRHGYRVDTAVSLTQARLMDPGGYDALIIDARIGAERGTELLGELRAVDPGAAGRCIMITGGSLDELPADVALLAKPFGPAELVAAVRQLGVRAGDVDQLASTGPGPPGPPAPGASAGPARPGSYPGVDAAAGHPGPGSTAGQVDAGPAPGDADAGGAGHEDASGGAGPDGPDGPGLLRLVARLRAAERAAVADFVHEGPLQDLTAARLGLQLAGAGAPDGLAGQLAAAGEQLGSVALVMRRLVDGAWSALGGRDLAGEVRGRAAWLVTGPVTVEVQPPGAVTAGPLPDLVELALFVLAGERQHPAAATVGIRLAGRQARIELALAGPAGTGPAGTAPAGTAPGLAGDPASPGPAAATEQALARLAAALGGTAAARFAGQTRQAWICLPAGWSGRAGPGEDDLPGGGPPEGGPREDGPREDGPREDGPPGAGPVTG